MGEDKQKSESEQQNETGAQQLSKHERRELEKQKQEEQKQLQQHAQDSKKALKKKIVWAIVAVAVVALIYWGFTAIKNMPKPYTSTEVHWHALVDIELCGKKTDLPRVGAGAHHRGMPLLHTHDDNKIHIEGQIFKREDIALGKFMDAVGAKFSNETIMEHRNGDKCPDGKEGTVKMFVNGIPNNEFRDWVPRDNDVVKIVFG